MLKPIIVCDQKNIHCQDYSQVPLKYFPDQGYGIHSECLVHDVVVRSAEYGVCHSKAKRGRDEATPIFHGPERSLPLHRSGLPNSVEDGLARNVVIDLSAPFYPLDVPPSDDRVRYVSPVAT